MSELTQTIEGEGITIWSEEGKGRLRSFALVARDCARHDHPGELYYAISKLKKEIETQFPEFNKYE